MEAEGGLDFVKDCFFGGGFFFFSSYGFGLGVSDCQSRNVKKGRTRKPWLVEKKKNQTDVLSHQ